MEETENWEVRFDKEFCDDEDGHIIDVWQSQDIKHFIRTEIKLAYYEGYELGLNVKKVLDL